MNPKRSCALLAYQCFMSFLFLFLLLYTLKLAIVVSSSGDSFLVFVTFGFTFLIDQAKQFATLGVIYVVVVRRFGFLKENEKEFVNSEDKEIQNENSIPRLKSCCMKTLEHQYTENLSLLTIGLYSVFILFDLTLSSLFTLDE